MCPRDGIFYPHLTTIKYSYILYRHVQSTEPINYHANVEVSKPIDKGIDWVDSQC